VSDVVEIRMPKLSDSMEEGTVLSWLKRPGDEVRRGEPLVEVETDKATIVYEAETNGVLEDIAVQEGESAALGAVVAHLRLTDGAPPAPAGKAGAGERPARKKRSRATPVARRLAEQLGVSLDGVQGSGPGGRIVAADLPGAPAPAARAEPEAEADGRGAVTEIPHTPTQRTIAERMSESRSSIPEFTLEAEIDMERAAYLRDDLGEGGFDPLPSFNDLVVRAAALALQDFPALNASFEAGKALRYERINVGIAVATDDALVVPTILDANRKSIFEIAAEARRLTAGARGRSLRPEDLADGTFTVTNLGMFGVRRFHAVINPPQAAILAVGEVARRAVVDGDDIVARTIVEVALSCDHRIVYGAEAARFLQRLRRLLEHPALLVAETAGA
jgi:pyruvate dehydrogenase E2 component (dihydrolipoamide acetyltransferase)